MRTTMALAIACMGLAILSSVARGQTVTSSSVSLTWTAPGNDSLTGTASQYDMRYSTSPITPSNFFSATRWTNMPAPLIAGTKQSVTITGLSPSTTYYFALKTADEVPNWSGISNVVQRTTLAAADLIRPAQVTTLTITGATQTTASLRWTAVGDDSLTGTAASYDVRYSTAPINDSNWGSATQVSGAPTPAASGTTQSMTVGGLARPIAYFAMRVIDHAGNQSALSNVVRWNWVVGTSPPQAPTGLNAIPLASGVRLTWNPNVEPNLASYTVYRRLRAGGTFDTLAFDVTTTQYVDATIPPGTSAVWYQIAALDQSGNESARSATATALLGSPGSTMATTWSLDTAYPNPGSVSTRVNISIHVPPAGPGSAQLRIIDAAGRLTRRLELSGLPSGSQTVEWDGRNAAGQQAAPGVYTVWLAGADTPRSVKIVRVQ